MTKKTHAVAPLASPGAAIVPFTVIAGGNRQPRIVAGAAPPMSPAVAALVLTVNQLEQLHPIYIEIIKDVVDDLLAKSASIDWHCGAQ